MALSNVLIVNVLYKYPECKTREEKYGLTGNCVFVGVCAIVLS